MHSLSIAWAEARAKWEARHEARANKERQKKASIQNATLAKLQAAREAKGYTVTRKIEMPDTVKVKIDDNNNIMSFIHPKNVEPKLTQL